MDFGLSDEQELLQATVRDFAARECPPKRLREIFDGESGEAPALWQGLAELGLPGLLVPEALGGAGLELLDLALVAEELGRAALPVPLFGHALATLAIASGGSAAQRERWLPRLASGALRGSVALAEGDDAWQPEQWKARLTADGLHGVKEYVPHAGGADLFVVGVAGGQLAVVEAGASGLRLEPDASLDRGRRHARLALAGAPAEALPGEGSGARLRDAGLVWLAAEAFGAASRLVRMTADYTGTRTQFGQPLAQFQALKHQLANMAVAIEPARGLWWFAAHAFDHVPEEAARAAAQAKAHVTDRAMQVARDAVEAHGGIGFTWECDVQIWFKRVLFARQFLGAPEVHRLRSAALGGW